MIFLYDKMFEYRLNNFTIKTMEISCEPTTITVTIDGVIMDGITNCSLMCWSEDSSKCEDVLEYIASDDNYILQFHCHGGESDWMGFTKSMELIVYRDKPRNIFTSIFFRDPPTKNMGN